jgi:hypothetical protein
VREEVSGPSWFFLVLPGATVTPAGGAGGFDLVDDLLADGLLDLLVGCGSAGHVWAGLR